MIFITQPRAGRSYNEIVALHFAAETLGWEGYPAPSGWRLPDDLIAQKPQGIPYGSQIFCEVIAQQLNWKLLANEFSWLAELPYRFVQRQIRFMDLSSARKLTTENFIKPADDKCFDAKVYKPGAFNPPEVLDPHTPCLVSEPVEFVKEYRFFVGNSQVLTGCTYLDEGQLVGIDNRYEDDLGDAQKFCQTVVDYFGSVNAVIDVGVIKDRGLAVVETNPIWASGIYRCDPIEVLKAMEGSVKYDDRVGDS